MKFEFSAVVKGVPAAEVKCNLECTEGELSVMLSDPVYQELGRKIIQEVSFKRESPSNRQPQANRNDHRSDRRNDRNANDRIDSLRRVVETEHKTQQAQNEALMKMVETINKRLHDHRQHKDWGEL